MRGLPPVWTAAVAGVVLVQFAAALRLLWRSRRALPPLREPAPALAIIVAFKGASRALDENVASLLAQEYPGPVSWSFVVAAADDPALPALKAAVEGRKNARVVVAGAAPERSSAKAVSLLAGVKDAGAAPGVYLFADADLRVEPSWARTMVAALGEPGTTASTLAMLYGDGGFASRRRLAWMAFGLAWFEPLSIAAGQSLAMRRSDFEALAIAELWRESVSEDLALAARVRERGGKIRFVAEAAPENREPGTLREALAQFDRWMTLFRYYQPRVWALGAATTALKVATVIQVLYWPPGWPLAVLVFGGDAACLFLALSAAGGRRRGVAGAFLLSPLLIAVYAANYAVSSFYREIVWSGWTYHLDVPRAEPGEAGARSARRRRFARLSAAALGGAALGLAQLPGAWGLLAWAALAPLLWAIDDASPAEAAAWGAVFGAAMYACGASWAYDFLRRFLLAGPPEASLLFAGICVLHGLRWSACAAAAALAPLGAKRTALFVLGAALLEPFVPTLFPAPFAVTQLFHLPTVQCLELFGEAGPAALLLAANAALFLLLKRRDARAVAFAALVAALALGNEAWGRRRLAAIETGAASRAVFRAGLVQGGHRPPAPPSPDRFAQDLPLYAALTRRAAADGARLIVWPESSYAGVVDYDPGSLAGARSDGRPLAAALRAEIASPAPLLLSAIGRGPDGLERNVSVLTGVDGGAVGVIEKTILAPFGEYMPGGRALSWLRERSPLTAHLSPGTGPRTLASGPARLGVMICFESMLAAQAERLAGLGANLLVAQVNDSWFDGTVEPEQHLRVSVLRAVENRRALLYAANTGISAAVSPSGRVLARIKNGNEGSLAWDAPLMDGPAGGPRAARGLFSLAGVLWAAGVLWSWRTARA